MCRLLKLSLVAAVLTASGCGDAPQADPPPVTETPAPAPPQTVAEAPSEPEPPPPPPDPVPVPAGLDPTACVIPQTAEQAPDPDRPELPPVPTEPADVIAHIDALEARLPDADAALGAAILLELGRIKNGLLVYRGSPYEALGERRDFRYYELDGGWLYIGSDYEQLIERYPESPFADDAAYTLARMDLFGGECEGHLPCEVGRGWFGLRDFLMAYPESPLVADAVSRSLRHFNYIPADADLQTRREYYSPSGFRRLLTSLDTVARAVPPPQGLRLLERVARLHWQLGEADAAERVLREVQAAADPETASCIDERLRGMEGDFLRLDPPEAYHANRVRLAWAGAPGATRQVVYRSTEQEVLGEVVGRPEPTDTTWTDEGLDPASSYWYQVVAETGSGVAQTNRALAETPSLRVRVQGISVSEVDRTLHVFGLLNSFYPQVLKISPDGGEIERRDAYYLGMGLNWNQFQDEMQEIFLAQTRLPGVVSSSGPAGAVPPDLLRGLTRGQDVLSRYPDPTRGPNMVIAVAEQAGQAWAETMSEHGGPFGSAMDCIPGTGHCWVGQMESGTLRGPDGRTVARFQLPTTESRRVATGVFADPQDGSAWFTFRNGRLAKVAADGSVVHDIDLQRALAPGRERFGMFATAGLAHDRALWLTWRADAQRQLVRIDVDAPAVIPEVILREAPFGTPVVDLEGGVWMVTGTEAIRYHRDGTVLLTVQLDGSGVGP